jgi:hypothetical protein
VKDENNDNKYGKCEQCGEPLMAAELYVDYERDEKRCVDRTPTA